MEALRSSETSVLTRTTQRHIPEDDILQVAMNIKNQYTASMVQSSQFLATDPEVLDSIPGVTRFSEKH
jgi:hypothetical protein